MESAVLERSALSHWVLKEAEKHNEELAVYTNSLVLLTQREHAMDWICGLDEIVDSGRRRKR